VLLIDIFKHGDDKQKTRVFQLYLKSIHKHINNWDLIDVSAPHIVGAYLEHKPPTILYDLVRSESLWERRVAMIATFRYIRKGSASVALEIAEMLVHDKHDLIQKAVGWMLREIGNYCSPSQALLWCEIPECLGQTLIILNGYLRLSKAIRRTMTAAENPPALTGGFSIALD